MKEVLWKTSNVTSPVTSVGMTTKSVVVKEVPQTGTEVLPTTVTTHLSMFDYV